MGDRIGRNGRILGKRGPDIDRLDDKAKRRLLEMSGIQDDDIAEDERDGLVKALLESNPDFLKEEEEKMCGDKEIDDKSQLRANKASPSSLPSSANDNDNFEDDDATQAPEQIMIDLDTDTDSRGEGRDQREEGSFSDRDDTAEKEPDGVCDREQQREGTSRGSAKAPLLPAGSTRLTKDDISEGLRDDSKNVSAMNAGDKCNETSKPLEVMDLTDCSRRMDEETQLYEDHLILDTQRSVKSVKAESDVIIPESPDSDSNDSTDMSLNDIRFEKKILAESRSMPKSKLLLQALNPLWPVLCSGNSDIDKDCYSQVVKLMFDLYKRRLCREQRRLSERLAWGKPVVAGPHVEGCLRSKASKRGQPLTETGEGCSRKDRLLRRHGNDWLSSKTKNDPYALGLSDNEDNVDDDDFQKTSSFKTGTEMKSLQVENGACNLIIEGSSRRSARLCTMKLAHANNFQSEDSDPDHDAEWNPGQKKIKGTNYPVKKRGPKKGKRKDEKPLDSNNGIQRGQIENFEIFKTDKRADGEETIDFSEQTLNFEGSMFSSKNKKTSLQTSSDIVEGEQNVNMNSSSPKRKYKFNSDSDDDSNLQESSPSHAKSPFGDHTILEDHQGMSGKIIVLSDSDQSNDTAKAELNFAASKEKPTSFTREKQNVDGCIVSKPSKLSDVTKKSHKLRGESPEPMSSGENQETPSPTEDTFDTEGTRFHSKTIKLNALPKESLVSEEQTIAPDAEDVSLPDVPSEEPRWSQSSNSLLDRDGQLFSTQIHRQKKNSLGVNTPDEKRGKPALIQTVPGVERDTPNSAAKNKDTISVSELVTRRHQVRKRKALRGMDSSSKRQAHAASVEEIAQQEVLDEEAAANEEEVDLVIAATTARTSRRLNTRLTTSRRNLADTPSTQVPATRDNQSGTNSDPSEDVEDVPRGEPQGARVEDQRQDVPHHGPGGVHREASLLEELTHELDEEAMQDCPICSKQFPLIAIEAHASTCGEDMGEDQQEPDQGFNYEEERSAVGDVHGRGQNYEMVRNLQAQSSRGRVTRSRRGDPGVH